jgi:hypothetical protein
MTVLGQLNTYLIATWRLMPNSSQLSQLHRLLQSGLDGKGLAKFMNETWKVKPTRKQMESLREILSGGAWTPNESRVDYVVQVLSAVGMLWSDDPFKNEAIQKVAEFKLKKLWEVESRQLPVGHEMICAKVFWDTVTIRFPNRAIYQILAVYGESVNRSKKPKRVNLTVQPRVCAERILFTL